MMKLRLLLGVVLLAAITFIGAPAHAVVWYVNDTSTVGDSFTSAGGNDGNDGRTTGGEAKSSHGSV